MFYSVGENFVDCHIRATTNAKQSSIEKIENNRIKIRINAVPENGKANKAIIDFLSDELGMAKSKMQIISGGKSRDKTIRIAGSSATIIRLIEGYLKTKQIS